MGDAEARILKNQIEIMWAIQYLLKKAAPNLIGRAGELDRMCDDLGLAARETRIMLVPKGL